MTITVGTAASEEPGIEFAVLGSFQARIDGEWHTPATRQIARVATMLAGWPGEVVELDRIVAGVWGDKAPATVRNTLQVHVSHLRRLVGRSLVRSSGDGYLLDAPPEAVDAEQFVEAVHDAARLRRRQHVARAAQVLEHGLGLWRGTPFADVTDPDLGARRERLAELRDQAREDLLECRLELCRDGYDLAAVIADAKELVARQPLREKGHVLLVRALAAADRPAEASAAFEAASSHLREQTGLDPSRALVDVHARSLAQDRSLLPAVQRSIRLVPDHDPADDAAARVAERVRAAVVDLGAHLVTAIEPDADRARHLAAVTADALADDLPGGVVVLDAADATAGTLADRLAQAPDTPAEPTPAGLAVVVAGWDPQVTRLAADLAAVPGTPLVVVGPRALGLGTEVVVWETASHRATGRPAARRGA